MAATKKTLLLRIRVSDEEVQELVISEAGAALSETIKKMMEDNGVADDGVINLSNLSNVGSSTVPMIIDYLETHAAAGLSGEQKWNFDCEFGSGKDIDFLQHLMLDAHALKIEGLKNLVAKKIADIIKIELDARVPTPEEKERREKEERRWRQRPMRVPTEEDKEGFIRRYPNVDRAALEQRCRRIQEEEQRWLEEQIEEQIEQAKIQ